MFLFLVKKMLSRPIDPVDDPFNFREVVDEFRKQKGMLYIWTKESFFAIWFIVCLLLINLQFRKGFYYFKVIYNKSDVKIYLDQIKYNFYQNIQTKQAGRCGELEKARRKNRRARFLQIKLIIIVTKNFWVQYELIFKW